MRSFKVVSCFVLALACCLAAHADVYSVDFTQQGGNTACNVRRTAPDSSKVQLLIPSPPSQLSLEAVFQGADGKEHRVRFADMPPKAEFAVTDVAASAKVQVKGKAAAADVTCTGDFTPNSSPAPTPQEPSTKPVPLPTDKDTEALIYLQSVEGSAELKRVKKLFPAKTVFLLHLPSGVAGAPFPQSESEDSFLQVLVVIPVTTQKAWPTLGLTLVTCPDRTTFRIFGSTDVFNGAQAQKQALDLSQQSAPQWAILPAGSRFRCGSGELVYHLQPPPDFTAPADTHLKLRPVYTLATTFVYGYDYGTETTFEVRSGKVAGFRDRAGSGLWIGFTWFPGGLDLEKLHGINYYFNPFLVFDPKTPAENFKVGTMFTWRGGVSLAVGASFRKITILKDLNEGDAFTGNGDIPTRKKWARHPSLFVGLALDSNAYETVKGFFGKDTTGK